MIRLYKWGRRNPQKVFIIVEIIIIFALIISIPVKDGSIEDYPSLVETEQAITDGLSLRTADMEKWKAANKTLYENIKKNADDMFKEIANFTYGAESMAKIFASEVDLTQYNQPERINKTTYEMPTYFADKENIGGPLKSELKYKYVATDAATGEDTEESVSVAIPNL